MHMPSSAVAIDEYGMSMSEQENVVLAAHGAAHRLQKEAQLLTHSEKTSTLATRIACRRTGK